MPFASDTYERNLIHAGGMTRTDYVKFAPLFTDGGRSFGRLASYFFRFTNMAVTLLAASIVTVQVGAVPLQAPLQPAKA